MLAASAVALVVLALFSTTASADDKTRMTDARLAKAMRVWGVIRGTCDSERCAPRTNKHQVVSCPQTGPYQCSEGYEDCFILPVVYTLAAGAPTPPNTVWCGLKKEENRYAVRGEDGRDRPFLDGDKEAKKAINKAYEAETGKSRKKKPNPRKKKDKTAGAGEESAGQADQTVEGKMEEEAPENPTTINPQDLFAPASGSANMATWENWQGTTRPLLKH